MKTIIAGSRSAKDYYDLIHAVNQCGWIPTSIVSGGASGADKMGELWAAEHGLPLSIFNADWDKFGRSAGVIRNKLMAQNAEALIALWDGKSKGTENMINEAKERGLKTYVYHVD